jgi:hypothetical protein
MINTVNLASIRIIEGCRVKATTDTLHTTSLKGIRADPASVRQVVRRTCPGVASAETDGGANGASLPGGRKARSIRHFTSSQAAGPITARRGRHAERCPLNDKMYLSMRGRSMARAAL